MFGTRSPEVTDDGYQYTVVDSNLATNSLVTISGTGSGQAGSISEMYDASMTTYYDVTLNDSLGSNSYMTFDLQRRVNNAIITAYFSVTGPGTGTFTVTLETSEDNSTWTTQSTVQRSGSGETLKVASVKTSLRYLRFHLNQTGSAAGTSQAKVYDLRVSKN